MPPHDVLITNPPYQGQHIQSVLEFAVNENRSRPFFLLLPCFVCFKKYFQHLAPERGLAFVKPRKRYTFWSPNRPFRGQIEPVKGNAADLRSGRPTAPMETMWILYLGEMKEEVAAWWRDNVAGGKRGLCDLASSVDELDLSGVHVWGSKRPNPKKRKRLQERRGEYAPPVPSSES